MSAWQTQVVIAEWMNEWGVDYRRWHPAAGIGGAWRVRRAPMNCDEAKIDCTATAKSTTRCIFRKTGARMVLISLVPALQRWYRDGVDETQNDGDFALCHS
ncbi:hypothetical protein [Escherichia coli]|uniref:hypothetical protein n=1 Tax=Escherichia coli TaxID=562 RepID=UPI0022281D18|nr:hypothetical protein [Escherichia coli]MCW3371898.1 hypothetical protein [Escherichia coli]